MSMKFQSQLGDFLRI